MRFLVDAQLPVALAKFLSQRGFDAIHTQELEKGNFTSDTEIIKISMNQERIVITKDSDFYNKFLLKCEPYKLIIISTGNIGTKELLEIFTKNIKRFEDEISLNSVLEISKDSIITIL